MGGGVQHLGQWVSLQLPRALMAVEDETYLSPNATTANAPSLSLPNHLPRPSSANPFRPSIAVIVGVLTTMFSITFLILLYAKHCRRTVGAGRPYGGAPGASFLGVGANSSGRRNSGVDRAVVESLPVFRFGSLRGRKEGLECAVCLCRFDSEELLRLLPKCKHAFHVECVDTWLDAHSTCPLCRHRVDPEDVLLAFHEYEPPAGPKPHPADAEGPSKSEELVVASTHSPAAPFGFFRAGRVSGRHSSAGEKRSNLALQVVVHQANSDDPTQRNSVDNVLMLRGAAATAKASVGCFDRVVGGGGGGGGGIRKDALLLAESAAAGSAMQQRFGHRIVVSGEGNLEGGSGGVHAAAVPRRWSDIRPQDLLLLRRELILADGGRTSSCSSSGASYGADRGAIGSRSVSEITGVSRFAAGGLAEEERALRRWPALASKRAGQWLGRREEAGAPC